MDGESEIAEIIIAPRYERKYSNIFQEYRNYLESFGLTINDCSYGEISVERRERINWAIDRLMESSEAIIEIDKKLYTSSFLFGLSIFKEPLLRTILKEITNKLKEKNIYFYYSRYMISCFNRTKKGREFIKYLYKLQEI